MSVSAPERKFGRIVLLLLGGITWDDWAALSSGNGVIAPNLQMVLDESDLAAARLAGASPFAEQPALPALYREQRVRVSMPVLRAATAISTGVSPASLPPLPSSAAVTLSAGDRLPAGIPTYEEANAGEAHLRRTGYQAPSDALVNLGWGMLQSAAPGDLKSWRYGALADAIHTAGGRTAAIGSSDTVPIPAVGLPLREWAVAATDAHGIIDTGDVSNRLLARDMEAPFGVRENRKAILQSLDAALADSSVELLAIEWGDTRRAAYYTPWCEPRLGAVQRRAALEGADALVQALLARLTIGDHMVIVAVPDLYSDAPQWLPLAMWQPQQRRYGAYLSPVKGSEETGVVALEALYPTLVQKFGHPLFRGAPSYLAPSRNRQPAAPRLAHLMALQSSAAWLDAARPVAHALLAAAFSLALLWVVWWALTRGTANIEKAVESAPQNTWLPRVLLASVMVLPLLFWVTGLCLQIFWRYGQPATQSGPGSSSGGPRYALALVCLSLLIAGVVAGAVCWFYPLRLRRVRVGVLWFFVTIAGLIIGGFALPWNSIFGDSLLQGPYVRSGDVWSLLLISATLLAIAGLTRSWYKGPALPDPVADARARRARRVINLRPAGYWILCVLILLGWDRGGHNRLACLLAAISCGALWLRLWLQNHEPHIRVHWRRGIFVAIIVVLLLWQHGGAGGFEQELAFWYQRWLATWQMPWWDAALLATLLCMLLLLTTLRGALRIYLQTRYTTRAMITATLLGSAVALVFYGSYGAVLVAFYPLTGLFYELLSQESPPREQPT